MSFEGYDKLKTEFINIVFNEGDFKSKMSLDVPDRYLFSVGQVLRQYTREDNIPSILNSNQLWLSKIDEMRNDATEGKYILDIFKRALKRLLDDGTISSVFYGDAVHIEFGPYLNRYFCFDGDLIPCDVYVASLTPEKDETWMVEEYGPICFELGSQVTQYLTMCGKYCPDVIKIVRVIYDTGRFEEYLYNSIKRLYEAEKPCDHKRVINYLSQLLSYYRVFVKDDKWSKEDERRLVVNLPKDGKLQKKLFEQMGMEPKLGGSKLALPIINLLSTIRIYAIEGGLFETVRTENLGKWTISDTLQTHYPLLKEAVICTRTESPDLSWQGTNPVDPDFDTSLHARARTCMRL